MEFRLLRSFLAVAREQSISGAARTLHITQPSLSRQIMDLEDEMGVKLFDRSARKIVLTNEGLLLRRRAEEILKDEKGMGTVEVILIILVLIGLVIIFKSQLTELVENIFEKITKQAGSI